MKLALYLYDMSGAKSAARMLLRLRQQFVFEQICVVYCAALDLRLLQALRDWQSMASEFDWLSYDGTDWEFAAYQMALDHFGTAPTSVLVMNDTAGRNYPFFRDDLKRLARLVECWKDDHQPIMIGKIEVAGTTFSLCQLSFVQWVRSNLFFLNAAAIRALQNNVFEPSIFAAPIYRDGRLILNVDVSPSLEQHLVRWMSPNVADHGWIVHSGRRNISQAVMRGKTGSILLEKRLSSRLVAAGGRLLSYEPESGMWWHSLRVRGFFSIRSRIKALFALLR